MVVVARQMQQVEERLNVRLGYYLGFIIKPLAAPTVFKPDNFIIFAVDPAEALPEKDQAVTP